MNIGFLIKVSQKHQRSLIKIVNCIDLKLQAFYMYFNTQTKLLSWIESQSIISNKNKVGEYLAVLILFRKLFYGTKVWNENYTNFYVNEL